MDYQISFFRLLFIGLNLNFLDKFQLPNQHFTTSPLQDFLCRLSRKLVRLHRFLKSLHIFLMCTFWKWLFARAPKGVFEKNENVLKNALSSHFLSRPLSEGRDVINMWQFSFFSFFSFSPVIYWTNQSRAITKCCSVIGQCYLGLHS